jgi:integrase
MSAVGTEVAAVIEGGFDRVAGVEGDGAACGRAAFAWAVKRGVVQNNPFADLPVSKGIAKRERVLGDEEITEIWRAAGEVGAPYGSIIRLLILTGQRRGEVAGMTWAEISDDLTTWTMPGERTKNGASHVVPLSAPARDLLEVFSRCHADCVAVTGRGSKLINDATSHSMVRQFDAMVSPTAPAPTTRTCSRPPSSKSKRLPTGDERDGHAVALNRLLQKSPARSGARSEETS